ncbi:MAG: type II toxin-antitoxin system Phd/YefM family antitoxin [Bryobacteraceae bacterium]
MVVSALGARTGFGKLLRRVEDERRSLVIEERGTPKAVLLSIRDYVRLAAPEPEVLRIIGRKQSAKAPTNLLPGRSIRLLRPLATPNQNADDSASADHRYQYRGLRGLETGRSAAHRLAPGDE